MKKNQIRTWLALGAAIALTGCQQPKNNDEITVETTTAVRHLNDSTGTYEIRIDFPVVKNGEALSVALNEWIDEQLGGSYGDAENVDYDKVLADTTALIDYYSKKIFEGNQKEFAEMSKGSPEVKEMGITYYDSLVIEKFAEGKNWITYTNKRDIYLLLRILDRLSARATDAASVGMFSQKQVVKNSNKFSRKDSSNILA